MADVRELGEFGLIDRLRTELGASRDPRVVIGIGDDAALWHGRGYVLATTDTLVADVHFLPGRVPWTDVGWKALAVNISDVAAMGGSPGIALVTLCLPRGTPVDDVDAIYAGLRECAGVYGVTVAGGDVVVAPVMSITVALIGEPALDSEDRPLVLTRAAARPGDTIAVTGPLGGSAGGLRALQQGLDDERARALIERHAHPWPRADAGGIAARAGIRCGIDISDGLVQDLGHVCKASGVDAEIRLSDVPLEDGLRELYGDEAPALAATGGEDYELLLCGGNGALRIADEALRRHLKLPDMQQLIAVGRITGPGDGRVRVLDADGLEVALPSGGWDHLREQRA